jgi:Conserved TM helix
MELPESILKIEYTGTMPHVYALQVKIDLTNAWKSWDRMLDAAIALLPNLILALVILIVFLILAAAARSMVRKISQRRNSHRNLGLLLGQLAYLAVVVIGLLTALLRSCAVLSCRRPHQNARNRQRSDWLCLSEYSAKFSRRNSHPDARTFSNRRLDKCHWP